MNVCEIWEVVLLRFNSICLLKFNFYKVELNIG